MADAPKQADKPATPKPEPKKYKVIRGTYGPFPMNHVFSRPEFERINPLPKDPIEKGIDPETYHDDLIGRGLALKVIAEVPSDVPVAKTPEGPESRPQQTVMNAGIREAVATAIEAEKAKESQTVVPRVEKHGGAM